MGGGEARATASELSRPSGVQWAGPLAGVAKRPLPMIFFLELNVHNFKSKFTEIFLEVATLLFIREYVFVGTINAQFHFHFLSKFIHKYRILRSQGALLPCLREICIWWTKYLRPVLVLIHKELGFEGLKDTDFNPHSKYYWGGLISPSKPPPPLPKPSYD